MGWSHGISWSEKPSGYVKIAIEHGPVEIVSLTIKNVVNIQKAIEHGHRNSEFNIV